MSFFLCFNSLIPLDLAIAFPIMKAIYTVFMVMDYEMVDEERSVEDLSIVGCEVKNLTTLEDLAKVNNIFCDKTGTLTKNQLIFRGMGVRDNAFDISNEWDLDNMKLFRESIDQYLSECKDQKEFFDFWRCICICHEVIQF